MPIWNALATAGVILLGGDAYRTACHVPVSSRIDPSGRSELHTIEPESAILLSSSNAPS